MSSQLSTSAKPTQKIYLDASSLKKLKCERLYKLAVVQGLTSKNTPYPFYMGKAGHLLVELIERNKDPLESMAVIIKKFPLLTEEDKDKLMSVGNRYRTSTYFNTAYVYGDGKPAVEHGFDIVVETIEFPECFYEIHLCGRIDWISLRGHVLNIVDWKTSHKASRERENTFAGYRNDIQFMFYWYIAMKYKKEFWGGLERVPEYTHVRVTVVLLEWIGGMIVPDGSGWAPTDEEVEEFQRVLHGELIPYVATLWEEERVGAKARRDGWFRNLCPKCDFNQICHGTEFERKILLDSMRIREWNPVNWEDGKDAV